MHAGSCVRACREAGVGRCSVVDLADPHTTSAPSRSSRYGPGATRDVDEDSSPSRPASAELARSPGGRPKQRPLELNRETIHTGEGL